MAHLIFNPPVLFRRISRLSVFSILIAILILGAAYQLSAPSNNPVSDDPPAPAASISETPGNWYTLYFTDPEDPSSKSLRGGPDKPLADAIRKARASVDVAVHQLNLWSIRDALLDAHRRGITVRVVTESDYIDEPEVQELIKTGISVLGDRREGRMHNKFVLIDRQEVWTGSMNLTINGAYRNHNNLVRLRLPQAAEDYTVEFEEMFVNDRFGPGSPANTPYPIIEMDNAVVEAYFSPDDNVANRLLELIAEAQDSVYIMAYSFTSDDLAEALIKSSHAGVQVSGIFDESQYKSNVGGEYGRLRAAGIDIRLDSSQGKMHHKTIIIDNQIVITGSYNFSASAEKYNDENVIIIHNPDIAAQFLSEFKELFNGGKRSNTLHGQ